MFAFVWFLCFSSPAWWGFFFVPSCFLPLKKKDLILVVNEFHERGVIIKSMNSTIIALIPKKEGIIGPKDFRPISLIESVYKIIAKVLPQKNPRSLE